MEIRRLGVVLLAFPLALSLVACSYGVDSPAIGEEGSDLSEQTDEQDTPLVDFGDVAHSNFGVYRMGEREACDTIFFTYRNHGLAIGCPTTLKICPDMLRDPFGVACLEYDGGTVMDCADTITAAGDCEQLRATSCSVVPIVDSAPNGCIEDLE